MAVHTVALIASLLAASAYLAVRNVDFSQRISTDGWKLPRTPQNAKYFESHGRAESKIDINEFLIGVIENFKDDMTVGIPELKVPILDPFIPKKPINIDVEDSKASVHGNFTDVHIEGLSGFEMDFLHADLHNLSLRFELRIPQIKAYGNYSINGKIIKIVPLRGDGEFRIESHNLSVSAKASLETSEDDHLQLSKDFDVEMDFDKVKLHLENFLGGGRWTEVLLKILNDISKDLFKKCLPLLKGELNKSLLKVINKHLMKLPITSIVPGSSANEYVDQILANVQKYVADNNLDPMDLPDFKSNFSKEIMYVTFHGEAKMFDGRLWGISSIHRTDECELNTTRTTITVSAHLGLKNLRLYYKGHAKFMSFGPSLISGGSIKEISFFFEIQQSNKKGAKPVLRLFDIIEMSTIWIELSGLGPLTWILKWLLTGMSKLVEDFIVQKMSCSIQGYLENEFEKYSFPV